MIEDLGFSVEPLGTAIGPIREPSPPSTRGLM
jgi:hypothetical protein